VINERTGAKVEGEEGRKFGNVFLTKKEGGGQMGRRGMGEKPYTKREGRKGDKKVQGGILFCAIHGGRGGA
jgi:hypothetical protein